MLYRFKSVASPLMRVSCDLESSFSSCTERETPLQMEISLVIVNFPYIRVIYTLFSKFLLYLLILKIILCQRGTFWSPIRESPVSLPWVSLLLFDSVEETGNLKGQPHQCAHKKGKDSSLREMNMHLSKQGKWM